MVALTKLPVKKEDVKNSGHTSYSLSSDIDEPLKFTGNWFIDAGILGFVNLMEEVYGEEWKKETGNENKDFLTILQEKIIYNEDLINCLYVYAFWYKVMKTTMESWILRKDILNSKELKKHNLEDIIIKKNAIIKLQEIFDNFYEQNINNNELSYDVVKSLVISLNSKLKKFIVDYFSEYSSYLKKAFSQNKLTIVEHIKKIGIISSFGYDGFFTSLYIFNPSSNKSGNEYKLLNYFINLISKGYVREDKKIKSLPKDMLDKSLNPLVFSASDFPNAYYAKPLTISFIRDTIISNPTIYLLSFPFSFINVMGKKYFFYAAHLPFTYSVNKKLKHYVDFLEMNGSNKKLNLMHITWSVIFDTLIEYKSVFSLENMYLIEYGNIESQQIKDVEYLSIPKLQAHILLDDTLRNVLNREIKDNKIEKTKWLIEEFVKNKSLIPYLLDNFNTYLTKKNHFIGWRNLIYLSLIDAKMKEFRHDNNIFGDNYLYAKYKNLVDEIKIEFKKGYNISHLFKQELDENDSSYLFMLLHTIKRNKKENFVTLILKKILKSKDNDSKNVIVQYLFSRILKNDVSWQNYALIILSQSTGGVSDGGNEQYEDDGEDVG